MDHHLEKFDIWFAHTYGPSSICAADKASVWQKYKSGGYVEISRTAAMRLIDRLDATERQILRYLVLGMSNKDIAAKTGIGLSNVETYRASMMEKLKAKRTADAVRIGLLGEVDRAN